MARVGEDITFGQLRTFACAARTGSFVKAANELGISQPAVSEQISALEQRLGYKLFERRRGTTPLLTRDAADILAKIEEILSASDTLFANSKRFPGKKKVPVRICIGPLLRDAYLKPLLPRICLDHPEIDLDFLPLVPLPDMATALEKGRVDLVVYTVGRPILNWPYVNQVCDVPTVMVAAPGTRRKLDRGEADIADLQFILPSTRQMAEHWTSMMLNDVGLTPRKAPVYMEFVDVILNMVEQGHGISILMYESVSKKLEAGELEVVGPKLPPMRRFIGRSPCAPKEAGVIEGYLFQAFLATAQQLNTVRTPHLFSEAFREEGLRNVSSSL